VIGREGGGKEGKKEGNVRQGEASNLHFGICHWDQLCKNLICTSVSVKFELLDYLDYFLWCG